MWGRTVFICSLTIYFFSSLNCKFISFAPISVGLFALFPYWVFGKVVYDRDSNLLVINSTDHFSSSSFIQCVPIMLTRFVSQNTHFPLSLKYHPCQTLNSYIYFLDSVFWFMNQLLVLLAGTYSVTLVLWYTKYILMISGEITT